MTQLFGSGDLSALISGLAEKSGVNSSIIQTMLPVATSLVMSCLSRGTRGGSQDELMNTLGMLSGQSEGLLGGLKSMAARLFGN